MGYHRGLLPILGWLVLIPAAPAAPPQPVVPSAAELASSLRGLILQFIPSPLVEDLSHWDQKKEFEEIKFRGKGLKIKAEKVKVQKNHGVWTRAVVTTPLLSETLVCEVRNLRQTDPQRIQFTLFLAFNAHIDWDRQRWDKGTRLFSGSVRARMRVLLTLNCEVQSRWEKGSGVLPDLVFRMRILSSDLKYDNLVVTHLPGIGGDLAQVLGDGLHSAVKQLRPSLERTLLEKANAAIVKAADTKEVRLSLGKVFGGK
jgi:hypothetical protein